jgi:hypothetical protein
MKNSKKLKIKSLKNWKWMDKDGIILHACFQLLTDFVEKEDKKSLTDWTYTEETKKEKAEIDTLYQWWKSYLKKFKKGKIDPFGDKGQFEEENEMLIRLIKIRHKLWT